MIDRLEVPRQIMARLRERAVLSTAADLAISNELPKLGGHALIPRLIETGVNQALIAVAVAEAMGIPLFSDQVEAREVGADWVIGIDGVLYMVNPLDVNVLTPLIERYQGVVKNWGVMAAYDTERFAARIVSYDDAEAADAKVEVDRLLDRACSLRATDVHFIPSGREVKVAVRLDGQLLEMKKMPLDGKYLAIANQLLQRARRHPGVYNVPVGGQFSHETQTRPVSLRLAMNPVVIGGVQRPSFVLRILGQDLRLVDLDSLGIPDTTHNQQLSRLKAVLEAPDGLMLVTGPTASGKSTTLNSAVRHMYKEDPSLRYYTIEDPVEVYVPGISQIEVNAEAGLTFHAALRGLLRSDPDVIMVGEMRDEETMRTSFSMALTGHFVLSTLHTNSAVMAIPRLLDLASGKTDGQPYDITLIADALRAVTAQRLIRRVCRKCAITTRASEALSAVKVAYGTGAARMLERYEHLPARYGDMHEFGALCNSTISIPGKGCPACENAGYAGRVLISEYLQVDDEVARMIATKAPAATVRAYAERELGYRPLWHHALSLVAQGVTTLDEAERVLNVRQPPRPPGTVRAVAAAGAR